MPKLTYTRFVNRCKTIDKMAGKCVDGKCLAIQKIQQLLNDVGLSNEDKDEMSDVRRFLELGMIIYTHFNCDGTKRNNPSLVENAPFIWSLLNTWERLNTVRNRSVISFNGSDGIFINQESQYVN